MYMYVHIISNTFSQSRVGHEWGASQLGAPQVSNTLPSQESCPASKKISRPSGLRADGSGTKRSPGRGVALSRDGQSTNSEKFTRKYHRFHYGIGRRNITLLAVILILAPHLSYHLAFPLLGVGAAGDEGDPV